MPRGEGPVTGGSRRRAARSRLTGSQSRDAAYRRSPARRRNAEPCTPVARDRPGRRRRPGPGENPENAEGRAHAWRETEGTTSGSIPWGRRRSIDRWKLPFPLKRRDLRIPRRRHPRPRRGRGLIWSRRAPRGHGVEARVEAIGVGNAEFPTGEQTIHSHGGPGAGRGERGSPPLGASRVRDAREAGGRG